jgi:hypothetical protein
VVTVCSTTALGQSTLSGYLRDVVSYHAPIIIAETADAEPNPEVQDHILPVDFDDNDVASDNAQHAIDGLVTNGAATAYFSIVETGSTFDRGYFFINYYFYHAQDGGAHFHSIYGTIDRHGHDNDMEGVALIVKKSFFAPYGTVIAAYSEAHGALIPWINPSSGYSAGQPAGGRLQGYIRFWHDETFDVYRPVVAIRSGKHGTFMAQDCSGQTQYLDLPMPGPAPHYGMWMGSPESNGTYTSCIHSDSHAITYVPVPLNVSPTSGIGATRLGPSVRTGTRWYQLKELAASPLWQYRASNGSLFTGNLVVMTGGNSGLDRFSATSTNTNFANPPWQWRGGPGECFNLYILGYGCWYSFGAENTDSYYSPADWPTAPNLGWVVTSPQAEAVLRFPYMAQATEPVRYNPYLASPPLCCGNYPLTGTIAGPTVVNYLSTAGWAAGVGGGTPPYTYHWSGIATGGGESTNAFIDTPGTLYLDVYDAAQHHLALSIYVQIICPPGAQFEPSLADGAESSSMQLPPICPT